MNHPASAYRQHAVQGATPVGLIVMLYDGIITRLQRAIAAIEARDIERKCAHLDRAIAIVTQLEGSLDFERGGEVAQALQRLYRHALNQILLANIRNSREMLRSLVQQFSAVREAWTQVEHPMAPSPAALTPSAPDSSGTPQSPSLRISA